MSSEVDFHENDYKNCVGSAVDRTVATFLVEGLLRTAPGDPTDWARLPDKLVQLADSAGRWFDELSLPEAPALPGLDSSEPLEYYRWQDEQGVWHFSDSPPPGVSAEPAPLATGTGPAMDSSITPPLPEGVSK